MDIMTSHGTLVCFDLREKRLLHLAVAEIDEATPCVEIELPSGWSRANFIAAIENDRGERRFAIPDGPLQGFEAQISADWRSIAFIRNGFYLSAAPSLPLLENDRTELQTWETFVCLSRDERTDLMFVFDHDWVVKSTGRLVRAGEISFAFPFLLRFGALSFDFRYNLPLLPAVRDQDMDGAAGRLQGSGRLFSITCLLDGWRIEEVHLFRPLILYAAFDSPIVHRQTDLSIRSLIEFGHYEGRVHLITDRDKEAVLRAVPELPERALSVQRVRAQDWPGYVGAKYSILDWREASTFQPIIFVDADIIFDRDIEAMLIEVALSERISAPIEMYHPLASHPGVGSTLIQAAGHSPRYAAGFNAGTLGIPNLPEHRKALELIRRIMVNRFDLFGRGNLHWVDQEIANYVSFCSANFDTHLLSKYVRVDGPGMEHDAAQRIGLSHFWQFGAPEKKLDGMTTYMETLRARILNA